MWGSEKSVYECIMQRLSPNIIFGRFKNNFKKLILVSDKFLKFFFL